MTSALEYVRYSCGMAGEEVADMVDRLEAEVALLSKSSILRTPVIVDTDADADEMNRLHGEGYGCDWVYPKDAKNSGRMTEEQKERFELRARDLMQWLCTNGHPHMTIIITPTTMELVEGIYARTTNEYVRD